MIPRYQTILFFVLLAVSLIMGVVLWQLLERHHQHMLSDQDSAPTQAPLVTPAEPATLEVANDAENTLTAEVQSLPLPQSPGDRARAILNRLLALYAAPGATHPLPGGANGVAQVFLLPAGGPNDPQRRGGELAVVNLTSAFAASHPSGLETETLTVLSICATLRANLPRVTAVRFLVDGQQRATLAGHVDLTRTYLTADALPTVGVHP